MHSNDINCYFFVSSTFEKINFTYGLNSNIDFELMGIKKNDTTNTGNMFLTILNNFDDIINILEESKKYADDDFYKLSSFLENRLCIINKDLSRIISNELTLYHSNEIDTIINTQNTLKHIRDELKKYSALLTNDDLYNQYYDDLIEEAQERIESSKDKTQIDSETSFLNDLYNEKSNTKKGKKSILDIIEDLKDNEKQYLEIEKESNQLTKHLKQYISMLINTITNYRYFFDLYYGILKESELKNKDISYFQSVFGINFEIPRYSIYSCYEKEENILPLKNLMFSIYKDLKNKNEKLTDNALYKKILITTNNLYDYHKIIYLKSYEINNLKDILNIYFNYFIENNICLKKCNNCGKYFIPTSRTDEKYCDNISPQNTSKTCKEYGVKKAYRDKLNSDKIKKSHYTTSQFFRMKINRAKTEKEKNTYTKLFENYKISYEKQKGKYRNKKINENDFIEWIKNQKNI